MADLALGPLLRYVGETEAIVWVETDSPCEVEVLGHRARSFQVHDRHYALVHVRGLDPGGEHPYDVLLDGERCWPPADSDFPPSAIRTIARDQKVRIAFGSCRVAVPHEPPYTLSRDEDERGREIDALHALALRMRGEEDEPWPHLLLMIGDQVYVDEDAPQTREFIRSRRDTSKPPYEEVNDFEEYVSLYHEAWTDPAIRWLFSTVSTAMVFDDHDVHDDWNTSKEWVEEMRATDWWHERMVSALMTYWIYQHLGNLPPDELENDEVFREVCEAGNGTEVLREYAVRSDREPEGVSWSYSRDVAGTRVIVFDSRIGRVLTDERRSIFDDHEWEWINDQARGDVDHLLLVDTLPFVLSPGMNYLEAWNEAVCDGAWGKGAKGAGEKVRRALDLEHWGAFQFSFRRLTELIRSVGAGERGEPPASIGLLAGDVHHAYLADIAFRRGDGVRSVVYQATCSPFRNPLDSHERAMIRFGASPLGTLIGRALARAAGVPDPDIRWRLTQGPYFDNQVATVDIDGRRADVRLEKTVPNDQEESRLETVFEWRIS